MADRPLLPAERRVYAGTLTLISLVPVALAGADPVVGPGQSPPVPGADDREEPPPKQPGDRILRRPDRRRVGIARSPSAIRRESLLSRRGDSPRSREVPVVAHLRGESSGHARGCGDRFVADCQRARDRAVAHPQLAEVLRLLGGPQVKRRVSVINDRGLERNGRSVCRRFGGDGATPGIASCRRVSPLSLSALPGALRRRRRLRRGSVFQGRRGARGRSERGRPDPGDASVAPPPARARPR